MECDNSLGHNCSLTRDCYFLFLCLLEQTQMNQSEQVITLFLTLEQNQITDYKQFTRREFTHLTNYMDL